MITLSALSGKVKLLPWQGFSSPTQPRSLSPPSPSSRALLNPQHVAISPATQFSRRKAGGQTLVTRAGPTKNQYVFAFLMPLSLIAVTVFTSMRIADKLDEDFLEEIAINQAIRETDEDDEVDMSIEEKPALPRTRNRPKREV